MTTHSTLHSLTELSSFKKPIHLAIGMFDGVHLGHRAVIKSAVHIAQHNDSKAAVLTFQPHPSRLFRPEKPTLLMTNPVCRAERMLELGVDFVIMQEFTPSFAKLTAEQFPTWLKQQVPTLESITVGTNFRFGAGRLGDVGLLIDQSKKIGLEVYSVDRMHHNHEAISSTRIRKLLQKGEIEAVNHLLGYSYHSSGAVVRGKALGRELGFPTLNLEWNVELYPRFGVYALKVYDKANPNHWKPAVANFGIRPTIAVSQEQPLLEIHILEETQWGLGDELKVEWCHFIRPEAKMSSLDELKAQIKIDCKSARDFLTRLKSE